VVENVGEGRAKAAREGGPVKEQGSGCYRLTADRIALKVKARPGAPRDGIIGARGGELLVSVRAIAENGKANREIVRVLADALSLRKDQVILKLGAGTAHKVFELPLSSLETLKKLGGGR
jgi:uncharacterized protein YggU (UPF0235/DUF167 family)